jgi:hypothetical protein
MQNNHSKKSYAGIEQQTLSDMASYDCIKELIGLKKENAYVVRIAGKMSDKVPSMLAVVSGKWGMSGREDTVPLSAIATG